MATVSHAEGTTQVSSRPSSSSDRTVRPGDRVLVALGVAIDTIPAEEGRARFEELRRIGRSLVPGR